MSVRKSRLYWPGGCASGFKQEIEHIMLVGTPISGQTLFELIVVSKAG
jgi:hypothetical protein